jgi:hypothetical protein
MILCESSYTELTKVEVSLLRARVCAALLGAQVNRKGKGVKGTRRGRKRGSVDCHAGLRGFPYCTRVTIEVLSGHKSRC